MDKGIKSIYRKFILISDPQACLKESGPKAKGAGLRKLDKEVAGSVRRNTDIQDKLQRKCQ